MYIDKNNLTYADISTMTADTWAAVDTDILRMNHQLRAAILTAPSPTMTTTADTVTSAQITATNFLKDLHVTLKDKTQIKIFMLL